MLHVGVVTRHDDFHAHVVQRLLEEQGVRCSLFYADSLAWIGGLSWSSTAPAQHGVAAGRVRDADGEVVVVGDLDVMWWRRLTGPPQIPVKLSDSAAQDIVVTDCQAALLGVLLTDFRGTWSSAPEATRTASNKLLQLRVAQRAGLRIPRTLVSQNPEAVREFCKDNQVVVKPVAGAQDVAVATGVVRPDLLTDDAIRICPAIYQECIPGARHLRISCFGNALHAALLETTTLDCRYPLDCAVSEYALDDDTAARIRCVLADLHLRMGMIDMKFDDRGALVWLEINPQGQFMFLEGMCGTLLLSRSFRDFLITEARLAASARYV
jgi:hypothetical protein